MNSKNSKAVINNSYQQNSKVLYTFVPNESFDK